MNRSNVVFFAVIFVLTLSGCVGEKDRTVEWYKEHETERKAKIAECENNPGKLANTPNCVNARVAQSYIQHEVWEKKGFK